MEANQLNHQLHPTVRRLMVLPLLRYISTPSGQSVSMETSHHHRGRIHQHKVVADVFLSAVNDEGFENGKEDLESDVVSMMFLKEYYYFFFSS